MQVPHWGQKLRVKFMQPPSPSPTKEYYRSISQCFSDSTGQCYLHEEFQATLK